MNLHQQALREPWYACPEAEGADPSVYCRSFDPALCERSSLPALVKDLFPLVQTPVFFYHRFHNQLRADPHHRIYLCFDQVISLCQVWLNGIPVGRHLHSEEPFQLDVTDALQEGENLLACRVYGPVKGKVGPEGVSMDAMPNFAQVYAYYTVIPKTGIYGGVHLRKRPLCFPEDLYLAPDLDTKTLNTQLTLNHCGSERVCAQVEYEVFDHGALRFSHCCSCTVEPNSRWENAVSFPMEELRPWSPDDPYLYDLVLTVTTPHGTERQTKRFGFKSLRVEDGWFVLNGKRIWLPGAHAIESKEAVVHAKTMGLKMLRYLTTMPSQEILDFCDEIGMLVYEECAAAWGMQDYPQMGEHMASYLSNMIRRDRSHTCVAVWGIFNEMAGPNRVMKSRRLGETTEVFDFAVNFLAKMRELDPTRLILLSSGRWDARADIGSFSNPHSLQWDYGWGEEGAEAPEQPFQKIRADLDPYIRRMGDNHLYPTVPIQNDVRDFVRTIGKEGGPVFLSEYGVGYQMDLYDLYYDLLPSCHKDHPSLPYYKVQMASLEEWISRYGLEGVYAHPRDFLMASIEAGAEQRRESIDPIRANPKICGYSLTSYTVSNEGAYYRNQSFIPALTDALRDSFAPLKWAVFFNSSQLYEGEPLDVEVVLCNQDVLPAGEYRAVLFLRGAQGVVLRKPFVFSYPQGKPLAASVLHTQVEGLAPGEYTLSLWLEDQAQPTCDKKCFCVHSFGELPPLEGEFCVLGEAEAAAELLCRHGMKLCEEAERVLVGRLSTEEEKVQALSLARRGKHVYLLDSGFWEKANTSEQNFMQSIEYDSPKEQEELSKFGSCIYVRNWLYHLDSYAARRESFEGLAPLGLLDMDRFRRVYPDRYFIHTHKPRITHCAAFGSGLFAENHCIGALVLGEFSFGEGRVTVNSFKLLEHLGTDPVADRLLYNLMRG